MSQYSGIKYYLRRNIFEVSVVAVVFLEGSVRFFAWLGVIVTCRTLLHDIPNGMKLRVHLWEVPGLPLIHSLVDLTKHLLIQIVDSEGIELIDTHIDEFPKFEKFCDCGINSFVGLYREGGI